MVDARWRDSAAGGNFRAAAAAAVGRRRRRRLFAAGHVEDVELAAGGGLDGVLGSGIVRDVVAVENVLIC